MRFHVSGCEEQGKCPKVSGILAMLLLPPPLFALLKRERINIGETDTIHIKISKLLIQGVTNRVCFPYGYK